MVVYLDLIHHKPVETRFSFPVPLVIMRMSENETTLDQVSLVLSLSTYSWRSRDLR